MDSKVLAIDPAAFLKATVKTRKATSEPDQAFAALFAQIAQNTENRTSVAALKTTSAQSSVNLTTVNSSQAEETVLYSPAGTPMARLEKALRESGAPLERFEVKAADRGQLEEALVQSGFSKEQAQEILTRASQKDGNINLGTLFNLIGQYMPAEGPVLLVNSQDMPLLIQALKNMGVAEKDIQEFVQSLPQKEGQMVVSGLANLLAKSTQAANGKSAEFKVDVSVLKDLLTSLGLSEEEAQTLISQSVNQNGKTDPKTFLAVLQVAAERQDQTMGEALKDLAAKLVISSTPEEATDDAARLRAQVIKLLEQAETGSKSQEGQDFKAAIKAALAAQDAEGGEGELSFGEENQGQGALKDSGRQTQEGTAREALNLAKNSQEASQSSLEKATAEQTTLKSQAAGDQPSADKTKSSTGEESLLAQTSRAASAAAGGTYTATQTQTSSAAQSPSSLPAYVVRQVSEQMVQMVRLQMSNLRLALKPPELGQLNLEISAKDGLVQATLRVENLAAKNTLEAGLEQLRQALGQQGLKVERLEVVVSPDTQQRQAQAESGSGNGSRRGREEADSGLEAVGLSETEQEDISLAARLALGAGSVNLFA